MTAAIAWRQMSPPAQRAVAALLARHPDYPRWIARADGDPAYTAFLEASTWADDIRKDPRFYDAPDPPTPPLPELADTARHRSWHYVDILPKGRRGELDRQIDRLARVLADRRQAARAVHALPWLIHLVGDAHQPLHVGVRDDEGGNRVAIDNPLNPRFRFTHLHTWWDDLPGPPWLRGRRLEKAAEALIAAHPPPEQGTPETWIAESRAISRRQAYPEGGGEPLVIHRDFFEMSRSLAQRRLSEAGYRLGRLLEGLLGG